MKADERYMARCLELARRAWGRTSPNPMVGAVVVRDGHIVGEGFHPQAGQPHAEVFALQQAREQAQGATLYVNLEPCNHYGRTPPCTEAILAAGIRRVVVGVIDPDPRVAGSGVARLQQAGIDVTVGVLADQCQELNEGFFHRVRTGRAFGILKYAMTLDGKIASATGDSLWVTGPEARQWVYTLRSRCDAVITGGNTVRHDNPSLTTHGMTPHSPLRVVMSRSLDLPLEASVWRVENGLRTVLITPPVSDPWPPLLKQLQALGVEWLPLDPCDPLTVSQTLAQRGCNTVLWECGGRLAAPAIRQGVVQKVVAFIAPKLIGGDSAPTPVGDLGRWRMQEALLLERCRWEMVGQDWLIQGYLPAETLL
ncbi:MAG: bifunctional diaminohydroxyphosphoribosylaminopyrimidine deaminase/5-amino-6-(5-phosphoribosylamino)uracil reductase RibD [Gloeomargarita sp. SKYBB_i_bin120]|nr:bifunctional diaminohydroxyphosphoribosylaminopyrimidine deaminase/5-amino-6-(5-phosphoribosylamino)uracil reductase RibD [Gloeomargarita sp. SKYG98]MCS7292841.1 bifunctional diaminohydroxyphosphoribosylaminopyrimidine deaminase/5-amino-6-(5-phosphoribosylamino)uracil reductase RibD [Gloeomargarita sp. SKYB120]MDW8178404.1 bifunctional diaminohydroxyphosphoribosylaminopyrimidine deaminase/5-amino-6-(5-phosphoribosylamino)uracil reductase RibD [Gloeomargarita sp. SKYBB_i_bin120]